MMKNKLETSKIVTWVAFTCFTFTLFISDFKHTHMFPNESGTLQEMFVNFDFQLKFLGYVFIFLPLLILTFLRHNLITKILAVILPLFLLGCYLVFSWAFDEDGYYLYEGSDYIGYYPHFGFYFSVGTIVLLLIAGVFKALAPISYKHRLVKDLIDDL